ncbi:putative queuosine biosynthesis protein QueE [Pseudomonas phage JG054]|uniref:Putative queuosine biosynthesis protein QueE n=1 Tax=Pseudomonas phage JG054 TaxID=1970800 RepID=A0A2H4GY86_9CAUD|nr:putative queuosine biosynthesis protein QueE [Pseudomonas phage JG054]ARB11181.1 putative queuosine biosynthesis protein QueE [Pseudomonas phage JG054]
MNQQPIEKRVRRADGQLSVHSVFYTIQGEGPFCGTPSVFIRLAGCNLQCPGCDTDYTSNRADTAPQALLDKVREYQSGGLVVITGGEPFRQDITRLLNVLTDAGYYVQIETNGTLEPVEYPYSTMPDIRTGVYVVCSPKAGKVHPRINEVACCFKYVIAHDSVNPDDGLPLKALHHRAHPHVARPPRNWARPVYLQPMDSKDDFINDLNLKTAIASCMAHGYILQLQVHKIINME